MYCWAYDLHLVKNPTVIFLLWKLFAWIGLGLYLFLVLISLGDNGFLWNGFLDLTRLYALFLLGFLAFVYLCYLVYAAVMGFRYRVLFKMDDVGLRHTQSPGQFRKAHRIAMIGAGVAARAGKNSARGSSILAGAKMSSYSRWSSLKSVELLPRRNVIKLNAPLNRNQVYASDADLAFVREFVLAHCPQAKIKER